MGRINVLMSMYNTPGCRAGAMCQTFVQIRTCKIHVCIFYITPALFTISGRRVNHEY